MAITASGRSFVNEAGNTTRFRGYVDPVIIAQRFNGTNYIGNWNNQLFIGSSSYGDPTTSWASLDDHEYFFKIFNMLNRYKRGNEKMLARWGTHDWWSTTIQFNCWKYNPTRYFEVLDAALEGAACNDCYLCLSTFGFADGQYTTTWQGLFDEQSAEYPEYVQYIQDTANHLAGKKGLFGIEMANEPDHDFQACNYWRYWWPNVDDAVDAYVSWAGTLHDDVKAGVSGDCLIGMGHAMQAAMFICDTWSGCNPVSCSQWNTRMDLGTAQFVTDCNIDQDFGSAHLYDLSSGSQLDVWRGRVDRTKAAFDAANVPGLIGEWANMNYYQTYSKVMDDYLVSKGLSHTCMRMLGADNYPPTQAMLDLVPETPAWGCSATIPPVCIEGVYGEPFTCESGVELYGKLCQNNQWILTNDTCPPVDEYGNPIGCVPQYIQCVEGGAVKVQECIDDALVPTGATCPYVPSRQAAWALAILGGAIGAYLVLRR
jgi:hypothetical protein